MKAQQQKYQSKDISSLSDNEIIGLYLIEDDNEYLGILFQRYSHLVFGACMKYLKNTEESKDAVMQIFEKLLSDLKNHKIDNFKSWLYSVSKNHCLMKLRKETTDNKAFDNYSKNIRQDFMEFHDELHPNNEEKIERKIIKLQSAINQLNEEQKTCVNLFYIQDKSYKEVADITGFELKKVKSFIQNGKRNLMLKLQEEDDE